MSLTFCLTVSKKQRKEKLGFKLHNLQFKQLGYEVN